MKQNPALRSPLCKVFSLFFLKCKTKETRKMCSIFHKLLQHALTGFYITTDLMQWEHPELLLYDESCPDNSVLLQSPSRKPSNLFNRARCDPRKTSSTLINITGSRDSHIKVQKWPTSDPMQINMFCSQILTQDYLDWTLISWFSWEQSMTNLGVIWRDCRKLIKVYLRSSVSNWAQEPVI